MFRLLIRVGLILLVLVAAGFFFIGYWTGGSGSAERTIGPTRSSPPAVDTVRARERGAELGEKAAQTAAAFDGAIDEGKLTAKIKAKMVLDDVVKARSISVTTNKSAVTLTGKVGSAKEKQRAVQLARETDGVTEVVDQLVIE
jgi:hypothetical protein